MSITREEKTQKKSLRKPKKGCLGGRSRIIILYYDACLGLKYMQYPRLVSLNIGMRLLVEISERLKYVKCYAAVDMG